MPDLQQTLVGAPIAIIGLGYVGLPLALAFGQRRRTLGFDIDARRVEELQGGEDSTRECSAADLAAASHLRITADEAELAQARIYIVAVPTPVDAHKRPDLSSLENASALIARRLKPGDLVIFEATVWPGCTEEVCVPILEQISGLRCATESSAAGGSAEVFHLGYSPERINPGDIAHSLASVVKVTAGCTPEAAEAVDRLYADIVPAGTYRAPSIAVAEAAKVIENTQRDLNIALVNELALIFNRLGLDTAEVLAAAGTKWNFLPFRPGLVGGHCIGVDPYYLTYKAEAIGYHPEVILAGRRINDGMGRYVAQEVIRLMVGRQIAIHGARVLILGLAFKENCGDFRNTRVIDIVGELKRFHIQVDVHDPWVEATRAQEELNLELKSEPPSAGYDAVILAVAHRQFLEAPPPGPRAYLKDDGILYDVKSVLPAKAVDGRL